MKVPFLDLKAQYETIKEEINIAIQDVIEHTAFAGGPYVSKFEEAFSEFCGSSYAIGVGSGTEALWFCLLGLGIGPGDEVITVPNTFIATAEAISFSGARPVFVDVDEKTYNMDPNLIESAITSKTKAIIPVHLFGQVADMEPIMAIAKKHGLYVVEDACQAHGAEYKGKKAGTFGVAGAFSFYPGKNLGAYGEAGAIVTDNLELADRIRVLRDHGQARKYYHNIIGWNGRMDGIQGAVLSVKLRYLTTWNDKRRKNAYLYNSMLKGIDGLVTPYEADYGKHVYHIYAIRVKERENVISKLAERGVSCGIHYPVPIHLQTAYSSLCLIEGRFPIAEKVTKEFVSLPMYPELTEEQIKHVVKELEGVLASM
ncbi:MAG: DegT/DnrJ/EryC1/StrS family aminotransferase [Syntrophorhabdaceae bacterium]|nr:DegT/DnrJ/EryC1/StrS family aminotransferase [Syntrophorhabdaceae bacterium]